jgi:hypothetical protein
MAPARFDAIAALSDEELAVAAGAELAHVPALRGARDLAEARETAALLRERPALVVTREAVPTLERFRELRIRSAKQLDSGGARELVRELKAVGGDLRALRLTLTGRERGPELWSVLAALDRDETIARVDAAL